MLPLTELPGQGWFDIFSRSHAITKIQTHKGVNKKVKTMEIPILMDNTGNILKNIFQTFLCACITCIHTYIYIMRVISYNTCLFKNKKYYNYFSKLVTFTNIQQASLKNIVPHVFGVQWWAMAIQSSLKDLKKADRQLNQQTLLNAVRTEESTWEHLIYFREVWTRKTSWKKCHLKLRGRMSKTMS